jgi:hypothetical protein
MSTPGASTTAPRVHAVQPQPHHDGSDDMPSLRFVPVERGPQRLAGAFVVDHDDVMWKPAVDLERVILAGLGLGAAVAAVGLAVRGRGGAGPVRTVTMGPGGWVSFRGSDAPRVVGLRRRNDPSSHRPWWAVLLRARPLG